jgi:hypothetical protein
MTKAVYFEMCEALGNQPKDDEIPVEYEDLYLDVQQVLGIYSKLKDEWDSMNGVYLGKSYAGISDIFDILEVPKEDRRMVFDLIESIDRIRSKIIEAKRPKQTNKPSAH